MHGRRAPVLSSDTLRLPGLSEALDAWTRPVHGEATYEGYTRWCTPVVARNPWLQRWVAAGATTQAMPEELVAWARAADAATRTVPEAEIADALACCEALRLAMQTLLIDEGECWHFVGLRGPTPAESVRVSATDRHDSEGAGARPWSELLSLVSADQPSPASHHGGRWPYRARVRKDDVLDTHQLRWMKVVLGRLRSARTARHHLSGELRGPLLLVDRPLAAGPWSGHAFVLRDLADLHLELQLTPQ